MKSSVLTDSAPGGRSGTSAAAFNSAEKKLIAGISLVMGLRMMGVSMVIPMFSIFATDLAGSTNTLAGVAVGIFGIVQILLLVPFGKMSDRWGRKHVTLFGLGIYMLGTMCSGLARNIHQLIGARIVAGAGAINGVTLAWLADGINVKKRNSALSYVGMSMGLSVIVGFTLSPIIAAKIGIPFLFFLCGGLILVTIVYAAVNLDNMAFPAIKPTDNRGEGLLAVLRSGDLLRLNIVGFIGNLSLSSVFFVLPLLFKQSIGLEGMWKVFVPVSLLGTALMFYFGRKADTHGTITIAAIGLVFELAGFAIAMFFSGITAYVAAFFLFYSGHCILSPVLPAAASRHPSPQLKGTVMSVFNSSQFLGSGIGGILSGAILEYDHRFVFVALALLTALAVVFLLGFKDYGRR